MVVAASGCGGTAADVGLARRSATPVTVAPPAVVEPAAPAPAPTTAPPTTAATTTTTTTAPPPPPAPPAPDLRPYAGLGTWVDVYDWTHAYGKDGPLVEVADMARMRAAGVQTLYIQTARYDTPSDVLELERLLPLLDEARRQGLWIVAWYLPTLEDPAADLRRLLAASRLPVDSVAVDIESRKVADVAERNRRLVQLSADLRAALPDAAIGAIPFPPVAMEVINPSFWPDFPWREIGPHYDVWLPMSYQSFRRHGDPYRDGYRYTAENIDRLRANIGVPDAPVHTIGGIADDTSPADVDGMVRAAAERGAIGGSLYDWRTTGAVLWASLQGFRR